MKQRVGIVFVLAASTVDSVFAGEEFAGTMWFYSGDPRGAA